MSVDQYLRILTYWVGGRPIVPCIRCLLHGKDILAIRVSSVASESSFSTGKRVLTPWRASLSCRTIESLLCTQSWLQKPIALDFLYDYVPDDNSNIEEELLGDMPVPEVFDP